MAPKVKVPMDFGLRLKDSPTHNSLKLNTSNGETVYASSVILSFNSPVIDHMTTTLHMTSVDMLEFSKSAVEVFVDAAYSGSADGINKEVFRDVNKLATVFEMKWLAENCASFFNELVDSIKEPLYEELVFLFEEAGFVYKTLKLADYIVVINRKVKSMKYLKKFLKKYLETPSDLSTDKLDMVIALAGYNVEYIVQILVKQLSELQGSCLPHSSRYLLEKCSLHLCQRNDPNLFEKLFDILISFPEIHLRWAFNLHRESCRSKVTFPDTVLANQSMTNLLPNLPHDVDLTMTLEKLVQWLFVSNKCTSLLMAVEAVTTWRQYHIGKVKELTPGVLSRLNERLKDLAKKRSWSLLPPVLKDFSFLSRDEEYCQSQDTPNIENHFKLFDPSSLISSGKSGYVIVDCKETFNFFESDPFSCLSTETKLRFHFKHPATPTCNLLSNCGFILKTVPSESALWKVKLCTEEEDYRNTMVHFHDEIRVHKIHLCFFGVAKSSDGDDTTTHYYLIPLSWLGWISSEEQRRSWGKQYRLNRRISSILVLYDTSG